MPLQPRANIARHPLLTYCNWSYDRSRHINETTLREMLSRFDDRYINYYLRMINETPRNVIDDFITQNNLSTHILENIYQTLVNRGFDLRGL
jgi:hypothetical protein